MPKIQYDQFVSDGFDPLGAFVMAIDGFPADERYHPTVELLKALDYQRSDSAEIGEGEFRIKTAGGGLSEAAMRTFFVAFKMGKFLIQYQPLNRDLFRGKQFKPHRPESDFRFADWYPVKDSSTVKRKGKIEDQLADDFPNAAMAAQFLHDQGFVRSNTHKRLPVNTYFVASRHGDGQPSEIVFRGASDIFFYDYYEDARYLMGASGLLMDHVQTERQIHDTLSIVSMNMPL